MKLTALRMEQIPSKLPVTVKLFDGPTPNYPAAHAVPEEDRIKLMQVGSYAPYCQCSRIANY